MRRGAAAACVNSLDMSRIHIRLAVVSATIAALTLLASSASAAAGCSGTGKRVHDPYSGRAYTSTYCHVYRKTQTFSLPGTTPGLTIQLTGELRAGKSWFVCQTRGGENMPRGTARNSMWLYTLADVPYNGRGWGWTDAVSISGGVNYGPVPGLRQCDRPR
jgi:hypothetical protein